MNCLHFSPRLVEDTVVEVERGRHPVIDLLLTEGEQYVANNTSMSVSALVFEGIKKTVTLYAYRIRI